MTKADVVAEIAQLAGVANPGSGVGSSLWKSFFNDLCQRFGLNVDGTMPEQAERIVRAAHLPYDRANFDSRDTDSGGGSTVTLDGLLQIREAVKILI